ncbi:MAG: NUDIX hydrolase [Opitutales bacterium]|nr:NUDIX hydrolase [Opitutales bacterium]
MCDEPQAPALWETIAETLIADCKVFKVYREHNRHPVDGREGDFFIAQAPDWATVIAITEDGRFIMEEQYRMASKNLSWEFPGGVIEAGEDPCECAARELLEETGYRGDKALLMASLSSNPALFTNRSHCILIKNCKKVAGTQLDSNEEIRVKLFSRDELFELARSPQMHHALMFSCLCELMLREPQLLGVKL